MAAASVSSEMAHGRFALNPRGRMALGGAWPHPGKGINTGGLFRGAVAAWLGGSMHAVNGVAIVHGDGLRDRRGRSPMAAPRPGTISI